MSVSIFRGLELVEEYYIMKKRELNLTFSLLKDNFAMPDKKTTGVL